MKKITSRRCFILLTVIALFASSIVHASPIVSLSPSSTSFLSGQSVLVDVLISGVPAGDVVSAYDLDTTYDSSLLSSTGVDFDIYLGDASLFEVLESDSGVNTAPGVVDFAALSLLSDAELLNLQSPLNGAFRLATLQFTALHDGQSNFKLNFAPGNDVKCANNQVCVPIPEPPVMWLIVLGLTLLLFQRKRNAISSSGKQLSHKSISEPRALVKLSILAWFALLGSLPVGIAAPVTGTNALYTTKTEFDLGTYLNTQATAPASVDPVPGQVQFSPTISPFPFVYIAASGRGTIVRIDVNNGKILGEYWTSPYKFGTNWRDPSRTTVDQKGNVWVTNRAEADESPPGSGQLKGSITRVGLIIGGERVDVNGNPVINGEYLKNTQAAPITYNTCVDRNPPFGLIKTSRGLTSILPWINASGVDTDGGVSTADDECIINYTRVTGTNTRTVAIDNNNDVWVGGANSEHEKLSGVTGQPIAGTQFNLGCGGYGGFIDKFGVLWSARFGNNLLRVDPGPPPVPNTGGACLNTTHGDYGLALDPNTCHVWHTTGIDPALPPNADPNDPNFDPTLYKGKVVEMDADGIVLNSYPHGKPFAQGVVVDGDNNVWVAHSRVGPASGTPNVPGIVPATTVGHLKTDGTFVGNVDLTDINTGAKGIGPTGVAVDTNGKIWAANFYTNNAMRIDPKAGPNGGGNFPTGVVNLTVDLGSGADPYNYSDMTGGVAIANPTLGFWSRVHDGLASGTSWGTIIWNGEKAGKVPTGSSIVVQARASDNQATLSGQTFIPVTSGVPFNLKGRYIEVEANLKSTANDLCKDSDSPTLSDLSIQAKAKCDIDGDGDGDVDIDDVNNIFKNRGKKPVGGNPPGDIDNDGLITVNDGRACTFQCTWPKCSTHP